MDASLFQPPHEVIATFTSAGWRVASFGTVTEPSSDYPNDQSSARGLLMSGASRVTSRNPTL
ncbi:MAG: hypothetical protein ACJ75C_11025 [Actinomycetes bacterium]